MSGPSIVFAAQVNSKYYAGDIAGAIDSSNNAKTWAWVSFGVGLGLALLYLLFFGAFVFSTASS